MQGQTIGHYRLDRVLGTGTFATVWEATDLLTDRQVAVKILADNWAHNLDIMGRFRAEARLLLSAESPRIVRGFQVGETATGSPYLVMGLADRGTLADRIEGRRHERPVFTPAHTAAILREIALGLRDLHQSGHLHRDLKPSNVLIRSTTSTDAIDGLEPGERIWLGDFGLVRPIDRSAFTLVAGSPGYVAPEQASGMSEMLTEKADVFPLGIIGVEMLVGLDGPTPHTMAEAAAPRPRPSKAIRQAGLDVPPALTELLDAASAHDPKRRPTVDEVIAALDAFAAVSSPPAGGITAPPPGLPSGWSVVSARQSRRRRLALAGGAGVVAVAAIGVGVTMWPDGDDEPSPGPTGTTVAAPPATDASGLPAITVPWSRDVVPLPPSAVLADGGSRSVFAADVAADVAAVESFYVGLDGEWRRQGDVERRGDQVVVTMQSDTTEAVITISPTAQTAGSGISHIDVVQTLR